MTISDSIDFRALDGLTDFAGAHIMRDPGAVLIVPARYRQLGVGDDIYRRVCLAVNAVVGHEAGSAVYEQIPESLG